MPEWIYAIGFFALMGFIGFSCHTSCREIVRQSTEEHQANIILYERLVNKLSKEESADA